MNTKHTLLRSKLVLSMAAGVLLTLLPWISAQANMLANGGFEIGSGGGATPTYWSKWGNCGQESWAAEWGTNGIAYWGWNSGGGGFYLGGIHCYSNAMYYLRLRGLREPEFNSCNIEVKLEFFQSDDSTWVGAITNVYASAGIAANNWSSYSVTSGATFANAARVRPVIAYPGTYTALGWGSQSYKWDNSMMYDRTLNYRSGEIAEEFAYDPDFDTSLNTKNRGGGFTNNWTESTAGKFTITDGNFGNLTGYPTNRGNKVQVNPQDSGANGSYTAYRSFAPITTGKVYFSTFVNYMWGTENGKWVGISLMSNATERAFVGALGISNKADRLNLVINSFGGTRVDSAYELADDTGNDYLIIGRYDFSTRQLSVKGYWAGASPDTIPAAEPATWDATANVSVTNIVMINGIRLGAGNASDANSPGNTYFDEVRVGRSWKELLNQPEDYTWDGNGLTANWGDATNWSGDVIPHAGTNATFYDAIPNGTNINLNLNTNVLGLKFNDTADTALNITNSTLTIGAGGIAVSSGSAGNHVIASAVALGANQTWTNESTTDITLKNLVSGAYTITKQGNTDGRFVLGGTNTFSGALTVANGRVLITTSNALGVISAGTVVNSGPGLQIQGGIITTLEPLTLNGNGYWGGGALQNVSGNNTFSGPITLGAKARVVATAGVLTLHTVTNGGFQAEFAGGGTISVTNIISGAGGVNKIDAGTLVLTNNNTYSGALTISGGVVQVSSDSSFGTAPGAATANQIRLDNGELYHVNTASFTLNANRGIGLGHVGGTLRVYSGRTLTYLGIIAGNGPLTKQAAGALTLGGANTYTGKTTITAGDITVTNDAALGAAPAAATAGQLTFNGGTLIINRSYTMSANRGIAMTGAGTIQANSGYALTYGGIMAGAGALTKTGAGTLTLTGSSTHSGNTFINAGFFIQNGTNTSSAVNVSAGGTMYGVGSVGALAVTGGVSAGTAASTVGNLRSTSMIIGPRGTNVVDMTAATGAAGTGWDVITVGSGAGTMTINGTAGASNIIRLVGSPGDFNNAANYSWTIVDAGTLSGFSTTNFSIDSSGFTPGLGGGTFSVANSSGDLKLNFTAAAAADISVLGTNLAAIADGDTAPQLADGTDFGDIAVNSVTHAHTFTITNSGTSSLNISNVVVGGAHAADFTVGASGSVAPNLITNPGFETNGMTWFQTGGGSEDGYNVAAAETGSYGAWITNNAGDHYIYQDIPSAAWSPNINSTFVFRVRAKMAGTLTGNVQMEIYHPWVGTISNRLTATLTTSWQTFELFYTPSSNPGENLQLRLANRTGGSSIGQVMYDTAYFGITNTTSGYAPVAAGGTTTFTVTFDPSAVGARTGTVYITNSVAGKTPYDFVITGTGTWAGIGRSPTTFNLTTMVGVSPAVQTFGVTNVGNGTLNYNISTGYSSAATGWMTTAPGTGSLTALVGRQHTNTIVVTGRVAGVYYATNTITDASASNSPLTIITTLTLTNIPSPSAQFANGDGREMVRIGWTPNATLTTVLVLYGTSAIGTEPTQNQSYSVGNTIGSATVIYQGTGSRLEHVVAPGNTHYYKFYTVNANHYSTGVTANATTPSYRAGEIVEPFAYTNGVTLSGGNKGNLFTNNWSVGAGTFTIVTNEGTASVPLMPNMPSYPTNAANRVRLTDPGNGGSGRAERSFAPFTSGKIYASAIVGYQYSGVNKWAGLSFMSNTTEKVFAGKVADGTYAYALGLSGVGGTVISSPEYQLRPWGNAPGTTGDVYLVILRYDFSTRVLNTKGYFRTDAVPTTEPATWDATDTLSVGDMNLVNGIRIHGGSSDGGATIGQVYFDEVRVAATWNDLFGVSQVVATNYTVNTTNFVSDGQVTGGTFNVSMYLRDLNGVETTNTVGPYFRPNFDLWNSGGIQILTDEVFNAFTYQDSGRTVYASDSSHAGAALAAVTLGVYTTRWSAANSNGQTSVDTSTLESGASMTFTVYDDDTNRPFGGNLLVNPGLEDGSGIYATDWWTYDAGGQGGATREPWAARTGSYGIAWHSWDATKWGGFGADIYANLATQSLVIFTMWGKAETGFASSASEAFIKLEFWSNVNYQSYVVTNDIYSALTNNYNQWVKYTVIWTNTARGITLVKPIVGSGNWIGGGAGCSVSWDDATLTFGYPLQVKIGITNYAASDYSTNAIFTLRDSDLAQVASGNPLRFVFQAWDDLSGLSRGINASTTNMNVDIGSWLTDNVTNYTESESSGFTDTFAGQSTSTWKFVNVNLPLLVNKTNLIAASLFDADNDRTGDQAVATNLQYGYVIVEDDDQDEPYGPNMLKNPSFEVGYLTAVPYWAWDYPNNHGASGGDVGVEAWRSRSGTNEASIRDWGVGGDNGYWWQEVTNAGAAGMTYEASIWAWNDAVYTNSWTTLSIEFRDGSSNVVAGCNTNTFSPPGETWTRYTVRATSSVNAAWARIVISAGGQGQSGAFQFDDAVLQALPTWEVRIGSTRYTPTDYSSNGVIIIDKTALEAVSASNPFYLILTASDPGSGLSRGTTDANTQMNVDLQNVDTDNVGNYVASNSCSTANTVKPNATNVWVWYSFSAGQVTAMTNTGANYVRVSVFDNDTDYTGDQLIVTNQQYGYIVVTGAPPVLSGVIYDGFASASGTLEGGSGGTGWSNNWVLGGSSLGTYSNGSFSTGYSSYADPTGNKVALDSTGGGTWNTASRNFDRVFTSGRVYFSYLMNYANNGNNKYAAINLLDGTTEKALVGKLYGYDKKLAIDADVDAVCTQTNDLENGSGNDYLIVGLYDFSTRELNATAYKVAAGASSEMVAEEPTGYWHVTTTQSVGYITQLTGFRLNAGGQAGEAVGTVYYDEVRVGTNWFQVTRKYGETNYVAMGNGPAPKLLYVGTNYNPALNPQGSASDITITDAQLTNLGDRLDFAVMWSNTFGVFMTNLNGTFNIGSRAGRVTPNWDPLSYGVSTNPLGYDSNFVSFVGANGALTVTTYVQTAFTLTNSTVGDTYYVTMSAENNNTNGGLITAPNGADNVPVLRALTINTNVQFYVTDDDSTYPSIENTNALQNIGFEIGNGIDIPYWNPWENAYATALSAYSGTNGLEFTTANGAWGNVWQGISASPSNIYAGGFYVRRDAATFNTPLVYIKIEFHNVPLGQTNLITSTETNIVSQLTTTWQYFSFAATSCPGTVQARLSIGYGPGSNAPVSTAMVDSVSFTEQPPPLFVRIGSTNYPARAGVWTSAVYCVTDGDLVKVAAGNPLTFSVRAYDTDAEGDTGLQRTNAVTAFGTNMSLNVANLTTNNTTNFSYAVSSANTKTLNATSVWSFTSISELIMTNWMAGGSNLVSSTIRDADMDRVGDQLSLTNQRLGFLRVVDDDVAVPAQGTSLLGAPLVLGVDGWYANMIDDFFDGTTIKYQWGWEAEANTMGAINNSYYLWATGAYSQVSMGSRHSYAWVNNVEYRYQFTMANMFTGENFRASLFLVGNDAGIQPYGYSDYQNPNVLIMQVGDYDASAVQNWGVKLYIKTDAPDVTAYDDSNPSVKLLGAMYSINYMTNTTFGFLLNQTNITLYATNASASVTFVTNLTAAQMAYFSTQAYVHVAGKNDNGSTRAGDFARISNVRIVPTLFTTNTVYVLTDGDLAYVTSSRPFRLNFPAYDTNSGLSRGITSATTQMNVTAVNFTTNNVTNYYATGSSTDTTISSATSIWQWTSFDSARITSLMSAASNRVSAILRDADSDRTADQSSVSNVQFGFMKITDDDVSGPTFRSFNVPSGSRTNLLPGSIVIISYASDAPKNFAFVPTMDLVPGVVIKFTDNGWQSSGSFRTGEGILTWTAPAAGVPAGLIVNVYTGDAATVSVSTGAISRSGSFDISASGDQLLAYQDTASATTFVYAVNADSTGWGNATDTATTALPTGLVDGVTAINIASGTEYDNGYYGGVRGGSSYTLMANVSTVGSWTRSDTAQTWPQWWFKVVNPDVYVEFSDDALVGGISITGLVQDGLSGVYRAGNYANSPTVTVYNSAGTVVAGSYFSSGPSSNGAAGPNPEGVSISGLVLSGDIYSVYTAKVVSVDYDSDRTGDSLSSTQLVILKIASDDDVVAPTSIAFQVRVGSRVADVHSGSGTDVVYRLTDGDLYNALPGTNLLADAGFESGGAGAWVLYGRCTIENWAQESGTYGLSLDAWDSPVNPPYNGGAYQDITTGVEPGKLYTFSIRGKREAQFYASNVLLKIEFMNASDTMLEGTTNDVLPSMPNSFADYIVQARAPATAAKIRTVIEMVHGTGDVGSCSVPWDNASLVTATSPVSFVFNAFDADSGLRRMGAMDASAYMNVTIEGLATNNTLNFTKTDSSSFLNTKVSTATSVWMWSSFSLTQITNLLPIGSTGQLYRVTGNLPDADTDRSGDSTWRSNQQFGFIYIVDDDTNGPTQGVMQPGNMLYNPSFEFAGSWTGAAAYWDHDLESHMDGSAGGTVGNYIRVGTNTGWRAHKGAFEAAIPARWDIHTNDNGGWWQEVTNEIGVGSTWIASGWFWSDNTGGKVWTAAWAGIEVEFYPGTNRLPSGKITNYATAFSPPGETWTYYAVTGTAPANAAWARVYVNASGLANGDEGALQLDDISLRVVTNVAMDLIIGERSVYRTGGGTNVTFRTTDGELAQVGSTNTLKYVFTFYDPTSGILRSTTDNFLNFDMGGQTELQNIRSIYATNLSTVDTTLNTATSVFEQLSNFTFTGPRAWVDGETGMVWKIMLDGTNEVRLSGPNADSDRDIPDREWGGLDQLSGRIVVTDDDTNGPWAWLEFVGSNYSAFGMWNTNPITDADMADGFDFAFGFWDPSGLFITNVIAGATNVDGNFGNVNINWDLYDPSAVAIVTEAIPPTTNLFSPQGNGSLNATIAVHNVAQLNYNNINTGVWALSVSAQDMDDDRGHNTVTNNSGVADTTVPWDRKVTGNQMLNFTVNDDDPVAPQFTSNANTRPLGVWIGTSNVTAGATVTTNAVFPVTDGDLASAGGTNMVRNFSFDSFNFAHWLNDITGWRVSDNPVDMHDGTYGAVNDILTNELAAEFRVLRQQIAAAPGEVFDASVYIKAVSVENSFSYLEVQFWNSSGVLIEPNGQFQSAHVTADQPFTFTTLSDMTAPAGTVTVSVRGVVAVLNTNYPTAMVDADFHIFDDFMLKKVDRPLKLVFSAYDGTSGMSRPGSDTNTDMNVDVGEWVTNNMANFVYGLSSADSTAAAATNVWRWENLNPYEIDVLYQGASNKVLASLFDSDNDRVNDRASQLDQQFGYLYVTDDDILPPEPRTITFGGISTKYLVVASNTTANGAIVDRWQQGGDAGPSNTGWRVTDGYIANLTSGNPLYFAIGAIDAGSGLARELEGETNTITLVNIGGVVDGSAAKTSYDLSRSSADGPNIVATNVWTFDGDPDFFTDTIISNLITIGTTTVFATLVDSDTDRPNDQSAVYTQKVGYLAVIDDDVALPSITSVRFGGQTSPTDADMTNSTFSITGLVQDASGIYGTASGSRPVYSLYSPTGLIGSANLAMDSQAIGDGGGTTASPLGKNNIPITYAQNMLGGWTARVTTVDYDNDGWTGDSLSGTSNFPFTVVDDDLLAPNISGASLGSGQAISGCSDLFISEYIEGSSFNKYIEIYNGTGNAVDLSIYRIVQYFNGSTTNQSGVYIINLTGTLANADTYVLAHSSATIWGGIPDQTNFWLQFNGDDVVALQKNGATVDVVGVIGSTNYPGADVTLSRKSSVVGPTTTYNTNEWDSYAIDTVNLLGGHLGPVTDGDLASASLTITGNVYDAGSGIYALGAQAPHYSIWQPNGTLVINSDTFSQAPAANGAAQAAAEPLSDAITGFTHNNIMLGMHTAIVTMVDYDNDRAGDTLTNNQTVSFMVIDDDTNAPLVGTSGYTNLLRNPSFETGGWDGYHAWGWQWDNPDQHGDTWGNGLWTNWHVVSGGYSGTIPGRWGVHTNVDGGWWQEVTNAYGFGSIWDASIWVWSDGGGTAWTSLYNALKIEFYLDDRVTQVGAATNTFTTPGETWTLISVMGTAPAGTVWSRFVLCAGGVGADGALQFDDAMLRPRVPLGVYLGSTPILADGNTSNATFTLTDGQAGQVTAGNPLILSFGAYDAQSGISRGNSSATTQMNVHVTSLVTNDVAHYSTPYSSGTSTNAASANVWSWESLTAGEMQSMIDAGSNMVSATLFDNDDDRIADRMSNTYVRFGFLKIIDDDTNNPVLSALQVNRGYPDDATNRVTDQEIRIGQWHMQVTVDDFSNISRSNTWNTFAPNFSVINAAGVTGITQRGWEGAYDVSTNTVNLWRNWAGAVAYTNVDLGYYTVVFSLQDEDNDRDGDRKSLTNSANVAITSNRFLVVDDDTNAPTAPSYVTIAPAYWTNVNYFVATFTNSADASGIWQYRSSSNAAAPTAYTNGYPMGLLSLTNTLSTIVSNAGFEVGGNGLGVSYYPNATNSWLSLGSDGSTGIWDSAEHHTGTNAMRHEVKDGWLWTGGGRYTLISQYISITNDLNQPVLISISAWFKGNMAYSAYGVTGVAFLKAECMNSNGSIGLTVENEVNDDHNGAPLSGVNATTWTNVILTVTNGPADTRTLLLSCGIESGGSGIALTGWWDNVSVTVKVIDTYGLGAVYTNATEGSNQVWLFSVDDDDDRVNDRLKSANTNFTIYLDKTPPAQVSGLQATEGAVDSTSEIDLQWTALPNGGGTGLSPWKSYRVYYTDDGSTPTTNSAYVDYSNYASLSTNTTTSLTLSNLVFGTDYKLGMAGLDRAGNLGPLSTVTNVTLLGFSVTQAVVSSASAVTSAVVSWSATNLQGSIVKEFDLIYADSLSFTEALTSSWNLVGSVSNSWYQDTGSSSRLPPSQLIYTMRFYRAAQKDAWRTNRNPRVASAEVYGLKTLRLYRGQNWVALPVIPDRLSVRDLFGVNLPADVSSAGYVTKISWYSRTNRWLAKTQIWLSRTGSVSQWNFAIGGVGLADTMVVPENEGFVIEIPTNAAQPQVIVIAGRVPTNSMTNAIIRKLDVGVLKGSYNMTSFRAPRTGVHPSEMGLLESGFRGGAGPTLSDRIRKFTRDKQQAGTDVWYQVSGGTGRWLLANTYPGSTNYPPVPENFFMSDDALMIWTVGSTNNWVWTNRVLYPAPTVRINP